jgi:hypothetical protein
MLLGFFDLVKQGQLQMHNDIAPEWYIRREFMVIQTIGAIFLFFSS